MWRSPSNQSLRRQAEGESRSQVTVQQLQWGPLHGEWAVPVPPRDNSQIENSTSTATASTATASTATTSTNTVNSAGQVSMGIQPSGHQTINIFTPKPAFEPISNVIASTTHGRIPRHTASYREHGGSYPRGDKQHITSRRSSSSDSQDSPCPTGTNSTKETSTFRSMETDCKEANQSTTESSNKATTSKRAYRTASPRTTSFHKSSNSHHQSTGSNHQINEQRMPDVGQGHCSNQPVNHDNAATPNGTDGRDSAECLYPQHNEGYIREYARDHGQVRILHWNAQGLNNSEKQSALVAALQLDNIDVAMIQDSRIVANNDGKAPLKVPNCHTYFIPASAECYGLITIIRNTLPSTTHPTIATSEGTEVLTTKVWIDKKPTLLHNIYRVRGEIAITEILAHRLPNILAGDFNAHHTLWCGSTNAPGRTLLNQIEDSNSYTIMNNPEFYTTIYDTTIDLTIVHSSIAAKSEWTLYDNLISDHYPIILTIQTKEIAPVNVPTPRWCLQKADWEAFKTKLTELCTTTRIDGTIEEQANGLTEILTEAAEYSIPKTKPHKENRKYWCYNEDVKLAKWSLNRALKKVRKKKRAGSQNLEPYKQKVRDANIKYKETCNKIRNKSWDDWLTTQTLTVKQYGNE